jgi:hypothetical protein
MGPSAIFIRENVKSTKRYLEKRCLAQVCDVKKDQPFHPPSFLCVTFMCLVSSVSFCFVTFFLFVAGNFLLVFSARVKTKKCDPMLRFQPQSASIKSWRTQVEVSLHIHVFGCTQSPRHVCRKLLFFNRNLIHLFF